MSLIRNNVNGNPLWGKISQVQCNLFRVMAVENPIMGFFLRTNINSSGRYHSKTIGGTFSRCDVIDSEQWQWKTPLGELSRDLMSLIWGAGSRKPLYRDIVEVQCHWIVPMSMENPFGRISQGQSINLGRWQSKTPSLGLSRGPMSSTRRSGSRKLHCRDFVESNAINSRSWQSKTSLPGLSRSPVSSIRGSGSRKPHWWNFLYSNVINSESW